MSVNSSEYLLTTSKSCEQWTACLWDYNSDSGNALQVYKNGGAALPRSLNRIGGSFVVTAEQDKPLLHIWPFNSQEQVKNVRLVLPDVASAVTVSPDNAFLAIGIETKLYVWQICNGKLLSVQEKNLQTITCIRFSANSDYLLTASRDGAVLAYNFGDLICLNGGHLVQNEIGQVEPVYGRMDHTLAVTDVHVGNFGLKSRFVTVSLDCTCRVYDLFTGEPLLQLVFDEPLTCTVVDSTCWNLYVGTKSGRIRQFRLHEPPRSFSHHPGGKAEEESELSFVGHRQAVNCLGLNLTDTSLVSGSDDRQVLVWNVRSRQVVNRIEHKGNVTNVMFLLNTTANSDLFGPNFKLEHALKSLERSIDADPNSNKFFVSAIQTDEDICFSDEDERRHDDHRKRLRSLEEEVNKLKVINKQLYNACTKKRVAN